MSELNTEAEGGGPGPEQYNDPIYAESVLRRLASLRGRGLTAEQISHRIALTHPERPGGGAWSPVTVGRMIELVDSDATGRIAQPPPTPVRSSPPPVRAPSVAPPVASRQPPRRQAEQRLPRSTEPVEPGGVRRRVPAPAVDMHDAGRTSRAGWLLGAATMALVVGIATTLAWTLGLFEDDSGVLSSEQDAASSGGDADSNEFEDASDAFDALASELPGEPSSSDDAADEDKFIIRIEPPADESDGGVAPATATIRNDGKLHVEGAFASESDADNFVARAGEVFGPDNIVSAYLINPDAPEPTVSDVALDKPVLFKSGSAEIDPEYIPFLEACGDVLKLNPTIVMSISAYTDSQGPSEFNLELSQERANAIVEFYRTLEIDDSQLVGVGLGEEAAFADNSTDDGRQQNRRAMLQLMNIMGEG